MRNRVYRDSTYSLPTNFKEVLGWTPFIYKPIVPSSCLFSYVFFRRIEKLVEKDTRQNDKINEMKMLISHVYGHEMGHFVGMEHYNTSNLSIMDSLTTYQYITTKYKNRDFEAFRLSE